MPLLAIAAVTAVVVAGTGAPALASPSDVSEAEGQLLTGGGLIDINGLAALAPAYSATPSGAAVSDSTLNLTAAGGVLGGINLNLGSGVQLPAGSTLANLLDIGVDGQHAATSVAGVAHAASGALTQAGTIDTSAGGDATKDSTVTLTPLLSAVPGASNIATDLTLQLGAIAAQADETGGASSATGAYEVSGGTLTVTSPLVSQLDSSLSSTLSNATATLNSALGSAGAVSAITGSLGPVTTALSNALSPVASVSNVKVSATVDTVDLSNVLATIGTVTSNGVSINLANGTISVDLGTLLGNGDGTLNGLPANTHLLTGSTVSGLLNGAINAAITALINQVDTAVTNELDGTNVNVVLTANVSTLVIPLATLDLKATGTVGQLLSGTPPFTVADNGSNLLGIIPVGNLITAVTTPLLDNVLPVVGTQLQSAVTGLTGNIGTLGTQLGSALGNTTTGLLSVVNQVVDIVVNVQERPGTFTTTGAGTPDLTERALQLNLLPGAGSPLATVNLASASVRGTVTLANLALSPSSGPTTGGTAVTVTGDNLGSATSLSIGGVTYAAGTAAAGNNQFTINSDGTLTFYTDAHAAGAVPVTVTNAQGTASAGNFTFLQVPANLALNPNQGPTAGGTTVTVSGTGLSNATSLTIGGNTLVPGTAPSATQFLINNDGTLTFVTPANAAGPVNVTVTNPNGTSAPVTYTYVAPPSALSLTPNQGPVAGGQSVTISGTNLANATQVSFGGTIFYLAGSTAAAANPGAPTFTQNAATGDIALSTPVASTAGAVNVTVTTAGGTSAPATYTYVAAPSALTLTPNEGPTTGGTAVTITGTAIAGATQVTVGGTAVTFTQDATGIHFTTAAHAAGPVGVVVTTVGGASAPQTFTYIPQPGALTLTPNAGPVAGGQTVTVSGTGLGGASSVDFGGTTFYPAGNAGNPAGAPTFTQNATTGDITLSTPAHAAGAVNVTVTTVGGTSPAAQYTYVAAPSGLALTPTAGPVAGGQQVTITGTGLGTASAVTFNGVQFTPGTPQAGNQAFVVNSDGSITLFTPASAAPGGVDVTVTNPGGTSAPLTYTYYNPPSVTSINPNQGPLTGGQTVVISGTDLGGATTVDFGGTTLYPAGDPSNPAGAPTFTQNPTTGDITVVTPAGSAAGPVTVTVNTPGGSSATSYTYVSAPTGLAIDPTEGPVGGGQTVDITGTAITGATQVDFGGTVYFPAGATGNPTGAPTFTQDSTGIHLLTPPAPGGTAQTVGVTVSTAGGTSAPVDYTYVAAPASLALNPNQGPAAGDQSVTVSGTGLDTATLVTFNGVAYQPGTAAIGVRQFTLNSNGTITLFTPPGTAGPANVTVTNPGGVGGPVVYTYVDQPAITGLNPDAGPVAGGQTVVISGSDLGGATSVDFGGTTFYPVGDTSAPSGAPTFTQNTTTGAVTLNTPAHAAGPVNVTVAAVGGTTPPQTYTYYNAPALASITPDQGPLSGGQTVTISGANLGGASSVDFGGTTFYPAGDPSAPSGAPTFTQSPTTGAITLATPSTSTAGPVNVTVTTPGGTSTLPYTYVAAPVISVAPDLGPVAGGTAVTITGSDLTGVSAVTIAGATFTPGTAAAGTTQFTVNADGSLTLYTPAHAAGPVNVTVTAVGGTSAPATFTYIAAPANLTLTPVAGPVAGGTLVTITGAGLTTATSIDFAGVVFTPGTAAAGVDQFTTSGGAITLYTPQHIAGPFDVTVTNPGGTSAPLTYTYYAVPAISGISPDQGPLSGGQTVTISGANLGGASSVDFGGTTFYPAGNAGNPVGAPTFTQDPTTGAITLSTPSTTTAGPVNVTVTTPGGTSSPSPYTYVAAPSSLALAPSHGPQSGGTAVTISGTNLGGASSVDFGGTTFYPAGNTGNPASAPTFTQNTTTGDITLSAPLSAAAGTVPVTVTTVGGTSAPVDYTYDPSPVLTTISPASGTTNGGNSVTLTGQNLADAATVAFGATTFTPAPTTSAPAAGNTFFAVNSDGTVTLFAPAAPSASATGPVSVTVTTPEGTTNAVTYTYDVITGQASITGTAQVGQTLTAVPGTWGPSGVVVSKTFAWYAGGALIGSGTTLVVPASAVGQVVTLNITGASDGPNGTYTPVTATATTAAVAPGAIMGQVSISGTPKVGQTLTAVPGTWSPSDAAIAYTWKLPNGTAIGTGTTLVVPASAAGQVITVSATGTKAGYSPLTVTASTASVAGGITAPTPTITGDAHVGGTLVANPGTPNPSDATPSYSWTICGTSTVLGTAQTLIVPTSASGKNVCVAVTWSKPGYASVTKTSAPKAVAATGSTPTVTRLWGQDRLGTALAVSQNTFPVAGSANVVFVAMSTNFPDALSAASAAVKLNGPLLLTPTNSLASQVTSEIKRLRPSKVVVVGGPNAVSPAVFNQLKALVPGTIRIGGADRYATSLLIAKYAFGSSNVPKAFVATGLDFPDALSAGAYAGSHDMPVLLVNGKSGAAPAAVTSWMRSAHTTTVSIAGGTAAVSQSIQHQLQTTTGHVVTRFGGADRYQTSQLINAQFSTAPVVYFATGSNFPDALTGAAAAGKVGAPLFVIQHGCVPGPVLTALRNWRTGTVKILGGPVALAKPAIENLAVCR